MKPICSLIILLFIAFNLESQLIPYGSNWNYYDAGSDPVPQSGTTWIETTYDDVLWPSGNGQLGFGDGDEATEISSGIITAYFRKSFSIADPSIYEALDLSLTYDDGAVIYINGVEAWRVNMPASAINYGTLSLASNGDNIEAYTRIGNMLVTGLNTIAVEVHQVTAGSTDLSFDFSLDPVLKEGQRIIALSSEWSYYDSGNEPLFQGGDSWESLEYDESGWNMGFTQAGYGDGDEITTIDDNALTVYYKKRFTIADPSLYSTIAMDLLYDDGAVVYINGVEVWRVNIGPGIVNYNTFTLTTSSDNALINTLINNDVLIAGENVVAVEVHQRSASSSDLSFDFSLEAFVTDQYVIIDENEAWNYYDNLQEPPLDGTNVWYEPAFNDMSWSNGNAELGYGDNDEATTINDQTETAYFRKDFDVSNPSLFNAVNLDLTYDDGAIVYLNGVEAWRVNMPSGAVDYNTTASGVVSNNAMMSSTIPNTLLPGNNTIAVEVHQSSTSSSDISFNLRMTGVVINNVALIAEGDTWNYYDLAMMPAPQNLTAWDDYLYDDVSWLAGIAQLGYGEGDENTGINNLAETAYFRKKITIEDPQFFNELNWKLTYDDGAIIYLNDKEVKRVNMPAGPVNYNSTASSASTSNATFDFTTENLLIKGDNVIAVEVHQSLTASTNMSFDLELIGGVNKELADIIRGPYLQSAAHDRMTIKWRTNFPTTTILDYGDGPGNLTSQVVNNTPTTEHEVTLTGLAAGTVYFYQVSDDLSVLMPAANDLYFKTYPALGTEEKLTAWILGDCGTGTNNQRAVRDAYASYIGQNHTDMMLFLGDNAYNDGTDPEYQEAIFENMYEDHLRNTVSWSCLGNHDGHSADSDNQSGPYYDIFTFPTAGESGGHPSGTEAYYSFDYGNIHFIVLDSYETNRTVGGPMYNWCQTDIQNTTAKWIVALWHHPPYSKGSHDSDVESNLVDMRTRFLPMLESNGVDLVLSGHSHSYERSFYLNGHYGIASTFDSNIHTIGENGDGNGRIGGDGAYREPAGGPQEGLGTVYITTGSAGKISGGDLDHDAMFYSMSTLGSCVMEVSGDSLTVKFINSNEVVDDFFTIVKCNSDSKVSTETNSGLGSLRQKVNDACAYDTIAIMPDVINPIILQSEIDINKKLTIIGQIPFSTLSGNNTSRVFHIGEMGDVELMNIEVIDGYSSINGGGVLNEGILTLNNSRFQNNNQVLVAKALTNQGLLKIKSNTSVTIKP
jgi:phage baseplate assembly protein gpV